MVWGRQDRELVHRPRATLGYSPPISRAPLPLDNVLGLLKYTEIKATWIKL